MTTTGVTDTARLPGPHRIVDNVRAVRRLLDEPAPVLDECAERFGPTFALGVGPVRLVVVGDPAHLRSVFAQPNASYKWGHVANALGFIVGPTSMIVSDGEDHRRRRAAVQPALARRRLDGWIPMMVAETDRAIAEHLEPALAEHDSVDLYPIGKDLILAITVKAFFGGGLEHRTADIGAIFDELQAYIEQPALRQLPHPVPKTRRARVRAARRAFDELVDDEIARRRRARRGAAAANSSDDRLDLLDAFVDDAAGMSSEEIHDQVNTLIGAGYNTTAATLAWTLQRALADAHMWAQLRDEANRVFGSDADTEALGPATVASLIYTRAVVHEALRLHPAGLFVPRQAVVDVSIADGRYVIPKNAMVMWSPYLAGRDATVWPEPLTFDPCRHLDPPADRAALMEDAWVPFGRGPRRCIGFALAQMELTLIVARIAQRVDVSLLHPATPRPYGMIVNRPDGGVRVRAVSPVPDGRDGHRSLPGAT